MENRMKRIEMMLVAVTLLFGPAGIALANEALAEETSVTAAQVTEATVAQNVETEAQADKPKMVEETNKSSWTDKIKFSGKSYINYHTLISEEKGGKKTTIKANSFEVPRFYLTLKAKPTDWSTLRLTLDMGRISDPKVEDASGDELGVKFDNRYFIYAKYAYLEMKEPWLKGKFTIGQQGLPWVGFVEKLWGYRWIDKTMTDLHKLQTSADLGASYTGKVKDFVEYQLAVVNGTGYKDPENNTFKNALGRVTGKFKGAQLSVFGSYDVRDGEDEKKDAWTVATLLGYKYKRAAVGVEYARGADRKHQDLGWGVSSFASVKPWKGSTAVLRYDYYDADTDADTDNTGYLIAGLGWEWEKHLKTLVNVRHNTKGDDKSLTGFWNWEASF